MLPVSRRLRQYIGTATWLVMAPPAPPFLTTFALRLGHLLLVNEVKCVHKRASWLLLLNVHVLVGGARVGWLVGWERLEVRFWWTLWQKGETRVVVQLLLKLLRNLMSLWRVVDDMLAATLRWPRLLPDLLYISNGCNSNLTHAVPFTTLAALTLPGLALPRCVVRPPIICRLVRLKCGLLCHWVVVVARRLLIHPVHHHHEDRVVWIVVT